MAFIQEIPYAAQNVASVTTFAIDLTALPKKANGRKVVAEIEVTGANIVIKYGYSAGMVPADYTLTSNRFPDDNYHCTAGTVKTINVPLAATHFSICPKSGGTAQVAINFGFEEK